MKNCKLIEETEQETADRKETLLKEFNDLVREVIRKVVIIALVLGGIYFLLYFFT